MNKKNKIYPTGIKVIDAAFGVHSKVAYLDVASDDTRKELAESDIKEYGIPGGSFVHINGESGLGKSTLAEQLAWGMVKDSENGVFAYFNTEGSVNSAHERIKKICGIDEADHRFWAYENSFESFDDVIRFIDDLAKDKKKHNRLDAPATVVVDSLSAVSRLTAFSDFYEACADMLMESNITMFVITHEPRKIDMSVDRPICGYNQLFGLPGKSFPQKLVDSMIKIHLVRARMKQDQQNCEKPMDSIPVRMEVSRAFSTNSAYFDLSLDLDKGFYDKEQTLYIIGSSPKQIFFRDEK